MIDQTNTDQWIRTSTVNYSPNVLYVRHGFQNNVNSKNKNNNNPQLSKKQTIKNEKSFNHFRNKFLVLFYFWRGQYQSTQILKSVVVKCSDSADWAFRNEQR